MKNGTMIKDYIDRYQLGKKELNEEVLDEMAARAKYVTKRQYMEEKETKPHSYYPSCATKPPCQNYFRYIGAEHTEMDAAALRKFWFGDILELNVIGLAKMAFKGTPHSIGLNNEQVLVKLGKYRDEEDAEERRGYIDGLLNFNHAWHEAQGYPSLRRKGKPDEETLLVEGKAMGDWAFKSFVSDGLNDTWGHKGQMTVYQRELEVRRYIYVGYSTNTGEIHEEIGTYDKDVARTADGYYDIVMEASLQKTTPRRPQRKDEKGKQMFMANGEAGGELGPICRYCSYKGACAKDLGLKLIEKPNPRGPFPYFKAVRE
jgi:hypothetical protein